MKLNRKWLLVLSLVLSVAMATGGTLAYLTSTDEATNTVTFGNVTIDLTEDSWSDTAVNRLVPGVALAKDPKITNTGSLNAYVWLTVSMDPNMAKVVTLGNIGSGWSQVGNGYTLDGDKAIYVLKHDAVLESGNTTVAAFGNVAMNASATNADVTAITNKDIVVTAYAIQSEGFTSVEEGMAAYTPSFLLTEVSTPAELVEALAAGKSVKLTADIDMANYATKINSRIDIPEGKNITIDLNGKTFTSKDGGADGGNWMAIYVNKNATLTLNDSVGGGKVVSSCYGVYVKENASFIMNGGTINVSGNGVYDMGIVLWNSNFVMNAGTINAKYGVWAYDYYQDAQECDVTIEQGCTVNGTVNDINISDALNTFLNVPSTVTVSRIKE